MIRRILLLPCTLLAFAAPIGGAEGAPGRTFNLAERRALKSYQEGKLVDLRKAIDAGAGKAVELEVRWDLIARPGEADRYGEDQYWTDIYFVPLAKAFTRITADQMGKEALGAQLKKVVITFDEKTAPISTYENGVTFVDGTLTVNWAPFTNAGDIEERATGIVKVLESKL